MLTEQNIKLFQKLGLPLYDEDADEKDVPFEDLLEEKPKEEIYAFVREVAKLLEGMEAGPYTMFTFKQACNSLARKEAGWVQYQGLCCKYIQNQQNVLRRTRRRTASAVGYEKPKSFNEEYWVF